MVFFITRTGTLLGALLLSIVAFGQPWLSVVQFGGEENESLSQLEAAGDGGLYICGSYGEGFGFGSEPFPWHGVSDVYLARLDSNDVPIWAVYGNGPDADESMGLALDSDGGVYWGGQFWIEASFGDTVLYAAPSAKGLYLCKYTGEGELAWARSLVGTGTKSMANVISCGDGAVCIAGHFSDSLWIADTALVASADTDIFVAQFSTSGQLLWIRQAGLGGVVRARSLVAGLGGISVVGDFQGNVVIGLDTLQSATPDADVFVSQWGYDGEPLWGRRAGGVHDSYSSAVAVDDNGYVYVTGYFTGVMRLGAGVEIQTQGFNIDAFLLKYGADGQPAWAANIGSADGVEYAKNISISAQNIVLSGYYKGLGWIAETALPDSDVFNGFVGAFTLDGNGQWAIHLASDGFLLPSEVVHLADDELAIGGSFLGNTLLGDNTLVSYGLYDMFLARLGEVNTQLVEPEREGIIRVYPNPAHRYLYVEVPSEECKLSIYTLTGEVVIKNQQLGYLDVGMLAAGTYILKVDACVEGAIYYRTFTRQ